ncbi:hypothetical protein GCM10010193_53030 [Kitasatospora atroaurantiaca]|uniref:RHS repeat-associated protein n=1 Tax=Kitasatospora atroaurantiaca TaxID=285545 RepID=A0A561EXJ3_9ACTN|nr:DUF6531 domain-containing protein [Kitasatospora atroaurantiaca]TWE20330.1 RHS repeat-associated protein [Kitasatospora atroaurantiaca]
MSNQIVKALEHGAQKLGKTLADDAGKALKNFYRKAGDNLKKVAHNTREADAKHAADLKKILDGGKKDMPHGPKGPGGGRRGKGERPLGRGGKRGQAADGNIGCRTAGDPVDVVSGQVITSETDLALPGLLPLVLRRAYASDYIGGRLHGPGWSSTLDQRIEIDADGIHYAGDDAQILHYPLPAQPGQPVHPLAGARWPLTWDPAADTIRIEDPDRGWTRHFTGSGTNSYRIGDIRPITALSDRNDHRIAFLRDESGHPIEVRHTGGYRVAVDITHTEAGPRVEGLRLLDGTAHGQGTTVVGYQYYPAGQLAGIVNSSGLPYIYEYDDADRMTAWIDRNGQSYEYVYDDAGRVVRGIGDGGHLSATFYYDTARRVTTSTDSLGHPTEYHYDEQHRVTTTVNPLGHTTLTEYDELGRVIARTDEVNRTTRFDLDDHGDPVLITAPDGSAIALGYNALRQVASVTRADVLLAAFDYDPRGNLLASTDAAGARTVRTYDERGNLVSVTDPLGHTRTLAANPAGLTTAVTDALGHTAHADFDAFGRMSALTDPMGGTTRFTRRLEGEILERIHPDGTRETWGYDAEGNVTEHRDPVGAVTTFATGHFGRLATRILPDGERQQFGYDTELQLVSVSTDGATWRYQYDAAGHLIGESDFNGRSLTYRHDGANQLLETIDSAGRSTTFAYNLLGDLVERVGHDGSATTLFYDDHGFLTRINGRDSALEYERDVAGRVLTESVDGRATAYAYDLIGRRIRRTTPTGVISTWTYDANSQPLSLSGALGALSFGYDASGRETTRYLGGGAALTQTWDACNRLSAQSIWALDGTPGSGAGTASGAYANVQERTYGYRADGLPAFATDRLRGRRDFDLTPSGRVTRVSADTWSESYVYDRLGNITRAEDSRNPNGATQGERAYTGSLLRTAGRTTYEYDDQGRLVRRLVRTLSGQRREWHYTWNAEDQLVRVDTPEHGSWTYRYDPIGRRTAKQQVGGVGSEGAGEVLFSWDGTQLIEECGALADGTVRTRTWDWEPGSWQPAAQTERSWHPQAGQADQSTVDERFFAIVTDLVGTPSELVATDGRVVWSAVTDLWGHRPRPSGGDEPSCPLSMPGQYHDDESGLDYNYFRYYDSATGRYLSTDPLGLAAGPNPHAYVPNPLAWIDPLGLAAKKQPSGMGGWYYKLKPANWTDGSNTQRYEINHVPAQATYKKLGLATDLNPGYGPSIRMEYDDHRKFISTGSGPGPDAWRAAQTSLIQQGKFDEAMKKDIDEIRRVHGTKYDAAIKEMADSLPHNAEFQKYLKDNNWKIRSCLLK